METAFREVEEETGLKHGEDYERVLGEFSKKQSYTLPSGKLKESDYFVGKMIEKSVGKIQISEEHTEFFWYDPCSDDFSWVGDGKFFEETKEMINDVSKKLQEHFAQN